MLLLFIIIIIIIVFLIIGENIERPFDLISEIDDLMISRPQSRSHTPQPQSRLQLPQSQQLLGGSNDAPQQQQPGAPRLSISLNRSSLAVAAARRDYQMPNVMSGADGGNNNNNDNNNNNNNSARRKLFVEISGMDSIEDVLNSELDFEILVNSEYSNDSDDYKYLVKKIKNPTKKSILKWNDSNVDE